MIEIIKNVKKSWKIGKEENEIEDKREDKINEIKGISEMGLRIECKGMWNVLKS